MITFDEPPDQHALYWPETDLRCARIAIRDDHAAANYDDTRPDAHWWPPNTNDDPITWDQLLNEVLAGDPQCHPEDAIILGPIDAHRTTNG